MKKMIYVVMGQTGEYSDRREWPVIASPCKAVAEKRAEDAADWARKNGYGTPEATAADRYEGDKRKQNPYDSGMDCDYTGTDYYVMAVDFVD